MRNKPIIRHYCVVRLQTGVVTGIFAGNGDTYLKSRTVAEILCAELKAEDPINDYEVQQIHAADKAFADARRRNARARFEVSGVVRGKGRTAVGPVGRRAVAKRAADTDSRRATNGSASDEAVATDASAHTAAGVAPR